MESVDAVVVGAGVVGLACARALARAGREVLILERERDFGTGISSRNSEVIHAGLYYPPGSLKARLCVAGREALYRFCGDHRVDCARLGKLVVAVTAAQEPALAALRARAAVNGVVGLAWLDRGEVAALEPHLDVYAALHSPDTGIVDSRALMRALLGDAEAAGAVLALDCRVVAGAVRPDGIAIRVAGGNGAETELRARVLVNAAGLDAAAVAGAIAGVPASAVPRLWYARGQYFSHTGRVPFQRLIYPLPEPGGLGIHLTLDLAGEGRFGPDVSWVEAPDHRVDADAAPRFAAAIRRWWPDLDAARLVPAYAGVRPKLVGPGMGESDFRIDGPAVHGVPGLVNLFGIESPGLTACLAIGDWVVGPGCLGV
ncbi:MAG: NAD(P)/FAD-dependent oxidoreductase [Porticoccaceae bacterium]|jgi:D-amino-acid oxidase|nr:NAD(P)/FAD-dependent oxidoreductase [Porticoccaceae bacterium]